MTPLTGFVLIPLAVAAVAAVLLFEALRAMHRQDDWDGRVADVIALNGCADPDCPQCRDTL